MNGILLLETHMLPFLLVFARVSGIFVLTPLFNIPEIPMRLRGWFSAAIALVIYPFASPPLPNFSKLSPEYFLVLAEGTIIGIIIGLFVVLYFNAFLMAGEFYSIQIGFGILNVVDPLSSAAVPILGQLKSLLGVLVFIVIGGHRMIIEAVTWSFHVLPTFTLDSAQPLAAGMVTGLGEMFVISFQLAAPIMGPIFIIELVMGILSKVAPQMNIMVAGFQVKIFVGLFLLTTLVPTAYVFGERLFVRSFQMIRTVLLAMGG